MAPVAATRDERVTVVTATLLEASLARLALRGRAPVVRTGIGPVADSLPAGPLVSCGLAGALSATLPPGSVVIPDVVGSPWGDVLACDPLLVRRLREAAARLGVAALAARLLTSTHVVLGLERTAWARRGWDAVDMETAGLFTASARVAAVRVILDAPGHELSVGWEGTWRAALNPARWSEALHLAPTAVRQALLAARVAAEAFAPPGRT